MPEVGIGDSPMEDEKTRRDSRFRDAIYVRLADQLFGTVGSMLSAMFASVVVAVVCWSRTHESTFLWTASAMLVLVFARTALLRLYQGERAVLGLTGIGVSRMRNWERAYVAGTLLWSATIGYTSYLGAQSGDTIVELFCGLLTIGCLGGSVGRNAARPGVLVVQLAALAAPYSLGLWETGEPWHRGVLALVACMALALRSSTRQVNGALVGAMTKEVEIRETNGHFRATLGNIPNGVCHVADDLTVLVANEQFDAILGCRAEVGARLDAALDAAGLDGTRLTSGNGDQGRLRMADGRLVEIRISRGDATVVVAEDVTERAAAQVKIEHMAWHDGLTGLPNASLVVKAIDEVADREAVDGPFSVLALDLDKFKEVNDSLGHPVGDALLVEVSRRLVAAVRKQDLVSRIGGDEFIVLMRGTEAEALAERLVEAVCRPYSIEDAEIRIGVSIGVAHSDGIARAVELRRRADMALYRAKDDANKRHCTYEPGMGVAARERAEMAADLRSAIADGDLILNFQPIVDVTTNRVGCCEALVRWNRRMADGTRKMVRPDQFIGLAEDTGLIVNLGAVVLRKACAAAARWPDDVRVAVNVSAMQMHGTILREQVREALAASGLAPDRLELEITESQSMEDLTVATRIMADMAALGVRIALDDFGTGRSSLAYLHKLDFAKVKIDRSFMRAALENEGARALVKMVVDFTASTGKALVMEGVETEDELAVMRSLGVRHVQGYLFSKPVPDEDLTAVLERHNATAAPVRRTVALVALSGGKRT